MSIRDYIAYQRKNLDAIGTIPHFGKLVVGVDECYGLAVSLLRPDTAVRFGQFLLLCHKSLLSAATLIAQGQPDDAAPVTRRAIEIARVCLASKIDPDNLDKWVAFEERQKRWAARQKGEKPPRLPPIKYDLPLDHPLLQDLEAELGILSDAYVHFTPEFFENQDWDIDESGDNPSVRLRYFNTQKRAVNLGLVTLAKLHLKILVIIDESVDHIFSETEEWKKLLTTAAELSNDLGMEFRSAPASPEPGQVDRSE